MKNTMTCGSSEARNCIHSILKSTVNSIVCFKYHNIYIVLLDSVSTDNIITLIRLIN